MNSIFELLKSPAFWFGSVIVGILINIASHYLVQKWGGWFSKFSKKWQTRTEALKNKREKRISALMHNYEEQQFFLTYSIQLRVSSIGHFLIVMFFLGVAIYVANQLNNYKVVTTTYYCLRIIIILCFLNVALGSFNALHNLYEAKRISGEVFEARTRQMKELVLLNDKTKA